MVIGNPRVPLRVGIKSGFVVATSNTLRKKSDMKIVTRRFSFSSAEALGMLMASIILAGFLGCSREKPAPKNDLPEKPAVAEPAITSTPAQSYIAGFSGKRIYSPAAIREWIESEPGFAKKKSEPVDFPVKEVFLDLYRTSNGWVNFEPSIVTVRPAPDKDLVFSCFSRETGLHGHTWIGVGENKGSSITFPGGSSLVFTATDTLLDVIINIPGEVAYLIHAEKGKPTASVLEIAGGT